MKYIALRTEDGEKKGKIAFYCSVLGVSRQGFYQYLANRDRPWKYQALADAMLGFVRRTPATILTDGLGCARLWS